MSDFASRFGPVAIVAGASEGLGAAFSTELAARGLNLVLLARREEPLKALARDLEARFGISCLALTIDVAAEDAAARLEAEIDALSLDVGLLVFNAAAALVSNFVDTPADVVDNIVDTNVRGLARFCHRLAPRLAARGRGGLLLMSSMSSVRGHALGATYAASKAFTTSLGEGLWAELEPRGVDVRVCCAGAITTPNFVGSSPSETRHHAMPQSRRRPSSTSRCARWRGAAPGPSSCRAGIIGRPMCCCGGSSAALGALALCRTTSSACTARLAIYGQ